ncbi:MAG TPA: alanine--tRNA ligase [Thermoplasmatales archaeon]|nr:alanine--tRNA ligase [Thermoplasmatales archaeon]
MDPKLQKEFDISFFKEHGYIRKKCRVCNSYFWTLDEKREVCGDQPCSPFSFIGKPLTKKPFTLSEMRETFLSFFEKHSHTRINPYPVVARWRKDIYLTIASIADFQPHVTAGIVTPPANPLVISQPSIRLNDLEEVGISGRHLTIFEMMGHHAFNSRDKFVYWTEETVFYCNDFLTKELGINEKEITYKESLWEGGGNAGPCLEVLAGGLEVATLVFMSLEEKENGDYLIEGKRYSPMPLKVVDTGYGLERLTWISQGSATIYDVLYPEIITWLDENSRVKDKHAIYALADHTKCLTFMLGDGIIPSNVKAGYLARLMIRRSLRFMDKLGINDSLFILIDMHMNNLAKDFPHLSKARERIQEIIEIETTKYRELLERGKRVVQRFLTEKKHIDVETLVDLYDTHGIHPDMVKQLAKDMGKDIKIPESFDSLVAERHSGEKEKEEKKTFALPELPSTRLLYYEDTYMKECKAKVLWSGIKDGKNVVILDKTVFYPEGGGQLADTGILKVSGKIVKVNHVEKQNNLVLHHVDKQIPEGTEVECEINWERRYALMRHHTGTHLINGACRIVLGDHIWQAGSQLDVNEARFDFSHYKSLSERDIERIESLANDFIEKGVNVEKKVMDRSEAEKLYGFRLYQGGVPEGRNIRVINIPNIDVEACGGTHLNNTREVERIKILKTERIQDGVNRLVFAAGKENVARLEEKEQIIWNHLYKKVEKLFIIKEKKTDQPSRELKEIASLFSVPVNKLEQTIEKFLREISIKNKESADNLTDACQKLFTMWKKTNKEKKKVPENLLKTLKKEGQKIDSITLIVIDQPDKIMSLDAVAVAGALVKGGKTVACISDGQGIIMASSDDIDIDLRPIAREVGKMLGGGGGGKKNMVKCGGSKSNQLQNAIKRAEEIIIQYLKKMQ